MRQPRLLGRGESIYHCITDALPKIDPFDDRDRVGFVANLHRMQDFTGVEVIAYSILERRIRLLLRVPDPENVSDRELNRRLRNYYPKELAEERVSELSKLRRGKSNGDYAERREAYTGRMYDLASFLKTLFQMLTQSYNPRHNWKGTIFRERFRSILVEPWEEAVLNVAAFIELDAVRLGLVSDPRDYRYCSFGAASAGNKRARASLLRLADYIEVPRGTKRPRDWRGFAPLYRKRIYPDEPMSANAVRKELAKRSPRLPIPVLLRCDLRYFDHGTVLGRPDFIEDVYLENDHIFPIGRKKLSYKMRFGDWGGLHSMRNPATDLIRVPKGYA